MTVGVINKGVQDVSIWGNASATMGRSPQQNPIERKVNLPTLKPTKQLHLSERTIERTVKQIINPFAAPNCSINDEIFIQNVLSNTFLSLTK
jgi:hypothetical protein